MNKLVTYPVSSEAPASAPRARRKGKAVPGGVWEKRVDKAVASWSEGVE